MTYKEWLEKKIVEKPDMKEILVDTIIHSMCTCHFFEDAKVNCEVKCEGCWDCEIEAKKDYWESITKIADKQREKGIASYGRRLEENSEMPATERIKMLQEELVDSLMYLEHIKDGIEELKESMCNKYCRYAVLHSSELLQQQCEKCPLNKL